MKKLYILSIPLFLFVATSCHKECECEKPEEKTLTTQPGPDDGQDAIIAMRASDGGLNAGASHNVVPELNAGTWTYNNEGWGVGTNRSYIKFPKLSDIPQTAVIKSAKLHLYGVSSSIAAPQGNSYYPASPYNSSGDNKTWLKRVTADWTEGTITWNNKPATSDENQIMLPESNAQWNFDITDIDVTNLVKEMVYNGENFGFCLQQQVEEYYRTITFGSSEATEATKRPKLVVVYEVK